MSLAEEKASCDSQFVRRVSSDARKYFNVRGYSNNVREEGC